MSAPDSDLEQELLEAESVEKLKARLEREFNELFQELRSLIPGANVLLGFLLAVTFTNEFGNLDRTERYVYFATLVSTAVAIVLFMAPAAHHRLRFREGDKDDILRKGNREAIAGTVASSFAFTGVLYLVTARIFGAPEAVIVSVAFFTFTAWRWWSLALLRTLRDERRRAS
jgi:amino acid transporter